MHITKRADYTKESDLMKYALNDPYLPHLADRYKNENYSEDFLDGATYCSACGGTIYSGEQYYDVGGSFFCMSCEKTAENIILDEVRDDYIYEL